MFESISVSPDGRHVLATVIERPFSFRTAYRGFPRRTFIMDKQGAVLTTLNERPLQEGRNSPNSTRGSEPRAFAWRPDGAGLSFLFREGEDDEQQLEGVDNDVRPEAKAPGESHHSEMSQEHARM